MKFINDYIYFSLILKTKILFLLIIRRSFAMDGGQKSTTVPWKHRLSSVRSIILQS